MFDFPLIAAPEIIAIEIKECGEGLIDIKSYGDLLYGPVPESPLTANDYTLMREQVYHKILLAQKELPLGYRFRLYEGYRSLKVQEMLFLQEKKRILAQNNALNELALFNQITEIVSPVVNFDGSENIPPHNTGGAIDIEIINREGELLDMGMACKDWQQVPHALCLTHYPHLSEKQKQNRQLLLDLMTAHDFVNYPTEWWHFSYGDRYWAYHHNTHAIYGSACGLKDS